MRLEVKSAVGLEVLFRELSRREDLDALMSVDHKQMPVATAHDLCVSGERTGDEHVVIRILANGRVWFPNFLPGCVLTYEVNPRMEVDGGIASMKPVCDLVVFCQDTIRDDKIKLPVAPRLENLERGTPEVNGGDHHIGIEDDFHAPIRSRRRSSR